MSEIVLTPEQARVLASLMEKALTTPDTYPLSLNSLRLACNQATNRDPVVNYDDSVVQHALDGLRELKLATRLKAPGERAIKFRQRATETLEVDDREYAVMCVLLLRGAQTPGELKQRTERLHRFADVGAIQRTLDGLAARELVAVLPRRAGHKEHRWEQLLCAVERTESAADNSGRVDNLARVDNSGRASRLDGGRIDDGRGEEGRGEGRVEHHATVADKTMKIRNPATHEVIRTVEVADETEIVAKLKRARTAQRAWAAKPYEERAAAVLRWRDTIAANAEQCAQITTSETGKAIAHSRNELNGVDERMTYYVEHAAAVCATMLVTLDDDLEEQITYEPRGVVAHISAWNYPYFVGLNSIVPALLCGNSVLYKPSELATLTGLQLVDLAHRSGIPTDLLQAVVGTGATGASLVTSGIDLVCFTGSFGTGRAIAKAAADRLTPVQLELGGKDAAYVCDDVDIPATAASIAEGVLYNAGQSCCAIERVYVHERIWEAFVSALRDAAGEWRPGDPLNDNTNMGALARDEQPAYLQAQIDDAVAKGGRVLLGGEMLQHAGNWYPATVVVDATPAMALMREESFGPVIGVAKVRNDIEAVEQFHDSEFGLTGAIFTADRARAEAFLQQLDVGTVYWNCSDRTTPRLPWAGRRHSGLGVSMSMAGIKAFVHEKAWHSRP